MSGLGQSRRFDGTSTTSGLPQPCGESGRCLLVAANVMLGMVPVSPRDVLRAAEQALRMITYKQMSISRGFALLIRPWPPAEKYPKPSRIVMARYLGQLELFPLERPKPAAYQLQLPLSGGYWWGLLAQPEVEKRAE